MWLNLMLLMQDDVAFFEEIFSAASPLAILYLGPEQLKGSSDLRG